VEVEFPEPQKLCPNGGGRSIHGRLWC